MLPTSKPSLPKPTARHIAAKRAASSQPPATSSSPLDAQCGSTRCPPPSPLCVPAQLFKWTLTILFTPLILLSLVFTAPLLFWMSVAVEGAKLKRSKSALPGQILFVLLFPLLMLQLAVSKMIGWKTVPFSWFASGEGFSPTMDKGFGGFVASFTDPFTGEPVGQTPSEQQGQQEDEAQTSQGGVAERLELNTHCGSTSCPQFSGVCMLTQYIKWMLVVLFTPLIAIGYLFTLPLNLIVLGMRMAQPDGYDGKPAAVFGVVCFWLMSPVLFLELAIFALIGKKWPPLDIFISEGTDQFDYHDWMDGTDHFVNPLTKERISVPCLGKKSSSEAQQPLV